MNFQKYATILFLILIFAGGFAVRMYRFNNPIADWHSWRQADTSAVSRNFADNGFDFLHPKYYDLSNVPSGMDNPNGYRFVEFPIYNATQAFLYKYVGIISLEEWGRIVSISSSMFAGLFLYLLVTRHSNKKIGILSAFFYMFIPYNIYYGRTILPDTSMVAATLAGIYFFDKWLSANKKVYFLGTTVFTALAILLKPYALFFTLPMIILAYNKWGFGFLRKWQLWIFAVLALTPISWWRIWMLQFPEGIPANQWLLNGNGIRFRPAFFRWIVFERIIKLISGYVGAIILFFGFIHVFKFKEWIFFVSFAVSSLFYVSVFATGNVQHDYYQILIMPTVSIFFAMGSMYLYQLIKNKYNQFASILVLSCLILVSFYFGWAQVKDYFNINNPSIIVAGSAVDRLTPIDAKVIANYNGDTSLLYQTKRRGWASFQNPIPEMIEKGADYLVLVNPTKQDMVFEKDYVVIEKTSQYVIFELHNN